MISVSQCRTCVTGSTVSYEVILFFNSKNNKRLYSHEESELVLIYMRLHCLFTMKKYHNDEIAR